MRHGLWARRALITAAAASIAILLGSGGEPAKNPNPDRQLLEQAEIKTDADSLFAYLRTHAPEDDLQRIDALVPQLGHKNFDQRQDATKRLLAVGPLALPALRKAVKDDDKEIARRAADCVAALDRDGGSGRSLAVVRLLLKQRPKGAAEALVRFLPFAAYDPDLEEEIWFGLDALTVRQLMPDPALVKALTDGNPSRRALAACIVGRRGTSAQRDEVRKLLHDAEPAVRLRAAQGLLAAKDKGGVPTLAALLADAPIDVAWQAEELLHWLAGDESPTPTVGRGAAAERKECVKAWQAWWQANGDKLDVAALDKEPRRPGLVLLCAGGEGRADGSVWLIGCDGRTRWQLDKLAHPVEARLLANNRVLIAECPGAGAGDHPGVTERDLDGTIRWQYQKLANPVTCQRLPNGNTFIGEQKCLFAEVRPDGTEVYTHKKYAELLKNGAYQHPRYLPNGRVVVTCVTSSFDPDLYSVIALEAPRVAGPPAHFAEELVDPTRSIEYTTDGNYLVTKIKKYKLPDIYAVERDAKGRIVWDYLLPTAFQATHLRNGTILLGDDRRVVEIIPTIGRSSFDGGRIVWEALSERQLNGIAPCMNFLRLGFDAPRDEDLSLRFSCTYRLKGLKSNDAWVRRRSVEMLTALGWSAVAAVPELQKMAANDPDPELRELAKAALPKVGRDAFPATLQALKDKDPKGRLKAVQELGHFGSASKVLAPLLIERLKDDEDWHVRKYAANELVLMLAEADIVVPALGEALRDPQPEVRYSAACSLASAKGKAKAAVPALLETVKHLPKDGFDVEQMTLIALGLAGAGDNRVVPALAEALKHWRCCDSAVRGLTCLGSEAADAVPAILKALDTPFPKEATFKQEETFRLNAVICLGAIGPDARKAIPTLIEIGKDEKNSRPLRGEAFEALGKIGVASPEVRATLEAAAMPGSDLQETATEALERLREER